MFSGKTWLENSYPITVKVMESNYSFQTLVKPSEKVELLYFAIADKTLFDPNLLRILYQGECLKKFKTIENYNIRENDTVFVVSSPRQRSLPVFNIIAQFTTIQPQIYNIPQNDSDRLRQVNNIRRTITRVYRRASNALQELASFNDNPQDLVNNSTLPYRIAGLIELVNCLNEELNDLHLYEYTNDHDQLSAN